MTDELDVLTRLVDYHDHISAPPVPVADDVRRGRRRVVRRRTLATGGAALAVAGIVLTASLLTHGDLDGAPDPARTPTPTPTPTKSQSALTWVDTVLAAHDGYGWDVPDPLWATQKAWFAAAADHLDPTGAHFDPRDRRSGPYDDVFTWREDGSLYPVSGQMGLIIDRGGLDPFDGCRYLRAGPEPSNGIVSCSAERFAGPDGQRARITRWQRLCSTWDPGSPGDDARPGPGSTYATCGDFRVAVAVERRDGSIGYLVATGRGTADYNPFTPAAMAAVAADLRLTLPEAAYSVPSNRAVEAVVVDHFAAYRDDPTSSLPDLPGYASVGGRVGRLGLSVRVLLAGGTPVCGRVWNTGCVERRVFGADDPATVFVGSWDEKDWADSSPVCGGRCPKGSRATSRVFVYVGPRHTVVVGESLVVKPGEAPVGSELDQRVIDLLLDPRLQ